MNLFGGMFSGKSKSRPVDLVKRFDLLGRVGQGSMSKVFRAVDRNSGVRVALKILDYEKTARFEARFAGLNKPTEGEVALSLNHANIVKTHEVGYATSGEQYLVMEFIEGIGLGYLIETQNEVMQANRLRFIIQLGRAIDYFHRLNWIHRDLCPRNVLLDSRYQVKLIDFGLTVPNTPDFQKPGNRTGTAAYMAPELIKRQRTDQRIDVFSYSMTCYEMYTKRLPWGAAATLEAVIQHINQPPVDIRDLAKGIDNTVAETIMKGLAHHPADRWPSIAPMIAQFHAAMNRMSQADDVSESAEDDDEYDEAELVE